MDGEAGTVARRGPNLDAAAVGLYQPTGQRQAQPGTGLVHGRVADLLELLEYPLLVGQGDPRAGVGDRQLDLPVRPVRGYEDPATFGGELDRVRQQVGEDLPQPDRVRGQRDRRYRD